MIQLALFLAVQQPLLLDKLESIRKGANLPAMGVAVIRNGEIKEITVTGLRKFDKPTRVEKGDKWHLGSDTKAMTATLIAKLVEIKKLKWTSTIAEIFPELRTKIKAEYLGATLEHLLCHRSGLSSVTFPATFKVPKPEIFAKNEVAHRLTYVTAVLNQEPIAKLGEKFTYSNSGYVVAGAIAERVMKKSWEKLIFEYVFNPLGIKSAGFGPMGKPGAILQPYQHTEIGGKLKSFEPTPDADNALVIGPAGTCHMSLGDWCKFVNAHLGNSPKYLSKAMLKKLHTAPFGGTYAFGWGVTQREWAKGPALTHSGSNTLNFCTAWLAPDRNFAVLSVTNCGIPAASRACDEAAGIAIDAYLK